MDLCKATLIGNVGGDPEQRFTPAGKSIVNFSLACNRLGPPPSEGAERRALENARQRLRATARWRRRGSVRIRTHFLRRTVLPINQWEAL